MKRTLGLYALCCAILAAQEVMYRPAKEGGTYMFKFEEARKIYERLAAEAR